MNRLDILKMIDHTLLAPNAAKSQIATLCQEALQYQFHSVCVHSLWVPYCKQLLAGSSVKVCTVIGFPLGAMHSEIKALEAEKSIQLGADEIDMVMSIGLLKSAETKQFYADIEKVKQSCHAHNALLKVIIETCLLTEQEKQEACIVCKEIGVDFVKTSTGFSGPGASVQDVALMRNIVGPDIGVKASGGIKNYRDAIAMIQAGASRLGSSSGVAIANDQEGTHAY